MPALNFQSRFAGDVEAGRKRQSIRATLRFKVGDAAHLFTAMRTKQCRRLGEGVVTEVLPFSLDRRLLHNKYGTRIDVEVTLDGLRLSAAEVYALALADGFSTAVQMAEWFLAQHGLPFAGWLIRWQPTAG